MKTIKTIKTSLLLAALPLAAHAGWLPTGWGDFYYTNTVNWTDGVIDNAYDAAFSGKATQNLLFDAPFTFTNGLSFTHPGEITTVFRGQGGNVAVRLLGDIEINKSANGSKGSLTFGSNTDGQHLDIDLGGAKRTIHNANLDVYLRNTLFNGDLRILNGNWAYLSGAGGIPAGTLEIAPASTIVLDSGVRNDAGATRAGSVLLTRSTLLARGNPGADSTETIAGPIVVDGSSGGASFISLNGCPHSLFARSMIFSQNSEIKVKVHLHCGMHDHLMVDGNVICELTDGSEVYICASEDHVDIIDICGGSFFSSVNSKLMMPLKGKTEEEK